MKQCISPISNICPQHSPDTDSATSTISHRPILDGSRALTIPPKLTSYSESSFQNFRIRNSSHRFRFSLLPLLLRWRNSNHPSSLLSRVRTFLPTRRFTKCRQIGTDRVLELEFTDGLNRLYLDFNAGGNVILVDKECTILAVLRIVPAAEDG
ncbi:hypothetical protein RUND412_010916 [Rhizina undulata]